MCITHVCATHMYYTCISTHNTHVGYTLLYYMCETCMLYSMYKCITGVWITYIIHQNTTHVNTYVSHNLIHMWHI